MDCPLSLFSSARVIPSAILTFICDIWREGHANFYGEVITGFSVALLSVIVLIIKIIHKSTKLNEQDRQLLKKYGDALDEIFKLTKKQQWKILSNRTVRQAILKEYATEKQWLPISRELNNILGHCVQSSEQEFFIAINRRLKHTSVIPNIPKVYNNYDSSSNRESNEVESCFPLVLTPFKAMLKEILQNLIMDQLEMMDIYNSEACKQALNKLYSDEIVSQLVSSSQGIDSPTIKLPKGRIFNDKEKLKLKSMLDKFIHSERVEALTITIPIILTGVSAIFMYLKYVEKLPFDFDFTATQAVDTINNIRTKCCDPPYFIVGMNGMMIELRNGPIQPTFDLLSILHPMDIHIISPSSCREKNQLMIVDKLFYPDYINTLYIEKNRIQSRMKKRKKLKKYCDNIWVNNFENLEPFGAIKSIKESPNPSNAYLVYPFQSLIAEKLQLASRRNDIATQCGDTFVVCRKEFLKNNHLTSGLNLAIQDATIELIGSKTKRDMIVDIMINDADYCKAAHRVSGAACMPDLLG